MVYVVTIFVSAGNFMCDLLFMCSARYQKTSPAIDLYALREEDAFGINSPLE